MPVRKKRTSTKKHLILFSKGIGAVALVVLAVAAISMFFRSPSVEEVVSLPVSQPVSIESSAEEFEEPTDPSGEMNGKWYGLCRKNSIQTVEDFRRTVQNDSVLAVHFASFDWENAQIGRQDQETKVHVAYRKDDVIRQTSKLVKLPKGDQYITDGTHIVRTACCNDYIVPPPVIPSAGKNIPPVYPPEVTPSAGGPPVETLTEALNLPPDFDPDYVLPIIPYERSHQPPIDIHPPIVPPPGPPSEPVPEPGTMLLFGSGLGALAAIFRKKRRHT